MHARDINVNVDAVPYLQGALRCTRYIMLLLQTALQLLTTEKCDSLNKSAYSPHTHCSPKAGADRSSCEPKSELALRPQALAAVEEAVQSYQYFS
eukprot:3786-Heterococcus_DN1.PRE.1